jgi:16S rRNA (guanine966-N2)-methyltransferase
LKLHESPDPANRPTKAVVRKSVFQRLEPWTGKSVCDLFAGIGTLGIEALSRGAERVAFVENNGPMLSVLEKNLIRLRGGEQWSINQMDVMAYLGTSPENFDVVLADPPYHTNTWSELFPFIELCLRPKGVFMMEASRHSAFPENIDVRVYGKTKVGLWWKA